MQYSLRDLDLYGNWLAYYSETDWLTTIEYFCTPNQPWLAITETGWKVMKFITVTATGKMNPWKCVLRAGWSPDFSFTATDLNTVKAYSFS